MISLDSLECLKKYLVRGLDGSYAINGMPKGYEAYVVRVNHMIGVFVPCSIQEKFHEKFSSVEIQYLPKIIFDGKEVSGLYLFMKEVNTNTNVLNEFSSICSNFIDPGENGANRHRIITSPLEWWKSWKSIIGNKSGEKLIHALIGEMMVYHYLLQKGKHFVWTGADMKRVDFVGANENIEVKSTVKRNGEEITVHGIFQLMLCEGTNLDVIFCRLEENSNGKSINDMIDLLVTDGCDKNELEQIVSDCGFFEGTNDRNIPYMLLEARKYPVDSNFPKITPNSFVGGEIPSGIKNLEYVVDLANLQYKKVDIVL